MTLVTRIQWADSTANPIMGCGGCELFPSPVQVLKQIDRYLAYRRHDRPTGEANRIFSGLLTFAIARLHHPGIDLGSLRFGCVDD